MLLRKLTLSHFRNVPLASLAFEGTRQFFAGSNGQGKSNLLEAAGCLTALRSFRTPDSRNLIRHDQTEAPPTVVEADTGPDELVLGAFSDPLGRHEPGSPVATQLVDHARGVYLADYGLHLDHQYLPPDVKDEVRASALARRCRSTDGA